MYKQRRLMVHCTRVNAGYMRLPGGLEGYEAMVSLYQRIAAQSEACAQAWLEERTCPPHEPATSAMWWAVVSWALSFCKDLDVDNQEWQEVFVSPHLGFASYLRSAAPSPSWELGARRSPVEAILLHDVRWIKLVIKLTTRWGLWRHLKDWRALWQARRLIQALRDITSEEARIYLKSDLRFFKDLFEPFPWAEETRKHLNAWLTLAHEEAPMGRPGILHKGGIYD